VIKATAYEPEDWSSITGGERFTVMATFRLSWEQTSPHRSCLSDEYCGEGGSFYTSTLPLRLYDMVLS